MNTLEHIYRVHNTDNFHWELLRKEVVDNVIISYTTKLSDGLFYIAKTWM